MRKYYRYDKIDKPISMVRQGNNERQREDGGIDKNDTVQRDNKRDKGETEEIYVGTYCP